MIDSGDLEAIMLSNLWEEKVISIQASWKGKKMREDAPCAQKYNGSKGACMPCLLALQLLVHSC